MSIMAQNFDDCIAEKFSDNFARLQTNLDSILLKYNKPFENLPVVNLKSFTVTEEIDHLRNSSRRTFGRTKLAVNNKLGSTYMLDKTETAFCNTTNLPVSQAEQGSNDEDSNVTDASSCSDKYITHYCSDGGKNVNITALAGVQADIIGDDPSDAETLSSISDSDDDDSTSKGNYSTAKAESDLSSDPDSDHSGITHRFISIQKSPHGSPAATPHKATRILNNTFTFDKTGNGSEVAVDNPRHKLGNTSHARNNKKLRKNIHGDLTDKGRTVSALNEHTSNGTQDSHHKSISPPRKFPPKMTSTVTGIRRTSPCKWASEESTQDPLSSSDSESSLESEDVSSEEEIYDESCDESNKESSQSGHSDILSSEMPIDDIIARQFDDVHTNTVEKMSKLKMPVGNSSIANDIISQYSDDEDVRWTLPKKSTIMKHATVITKSPKGIRNDCLSSDGDRSHAAIRKQSKNSCKHTVEAHKSPKSRNTTPLSRKNKKSGETASSLEDEIDRERNKHNPGLSHVNSKCVVDLPRSSVQSQHNHKPIQRIKPTPVLVGHRGPDDNAFKVPIMPKQIHRSMHTRLSDGAGNLQSSAITTGFPRGYQCVQQPTKLSHSVPPKVRQTQAPVNIREARKSVSIVPKVKPIIQHPQYTDRELMHYLISPACKTLPGLPDLDEEYDRHILHSRPKFQNKNSVESVSKNTSHEAKQTVYQRRKTQSPDVSRNSAAVTPVSGSLMETLAKLKMGTPPVSHPEKGAVQRVPGSRKKLLMGSDCDYSSSQSDAANDDTRSTSSGLLGDIDSEESETLQESSELSLLSVMAECSDDSQSDEETVILVLSPDRNLIKQQSELSAQEFKTPHSVAISQKDQASPSVLFSRLKLQSPVCVSAKPVSLVNSEVKNKSKDDVGKGKTEDISVNGVKTPVKSSPKAKTDLKNQFNSGKVTMRSKASLLQSLKKSALVTQERNELSAAVKDSMEISSGIKSQNSSKNISATNPPRHVTHISPAKILTPCTTCPSRDRDTPGRSHSLRTSSKCSSKSPASYNQSRNSQGKYAPQLSDNRQHHSPDHWSKRSYTKLAAVSPSVRQHSSKITPRIMTKSRSAITSTPNKRGKMKEFDLSSISVIEPPSKLKENDQVNLNIPFAGLCSPSTNENRTPNKFFKTRDGVGSPIHAAVLSSDNGHNLDDFLSDERKASKNNADLTFGFSEHLRTAPAVPLQEKSNTVKYLPDSNIPLPAFPPEKVSDAYAFPDSGDAYPYSFQHDSDVEITKKSESTRMKKKLSPKKQEYLSPARSKSWFAKTRLKFEELGKVSEHHSVKRKRSTTDHDDLAAQLDAVCASVKTKRTKKNSLDLVCTPSKTKKTGSRNLTPSDKSKMNTTTFSMTSSIMDKSDMCPGPEHCTKSFCFSCIKD